MTTSPLAVKVSLKFQKEMMLAAEKLSLNGDCVLTPIYPTSESIEKTEDEIKNLKEEHFKRIELSDAIYVINKDNYIGESTKLEIEYAKKLGVKVASPVFDGVTQKDLIEIMNEAREKDIRDGQEDSRNKRAIIDENGKTLQEIMEQFLIIYFNETL